MKDDWFVELKVGDTIRHKTSGESYVVIYPLIPWGFVVERTTTATHPGEWVLVRKGIPAHNPENWHPINKEDR